MKTENRLTQLINRIGFGNVNRPPMKIASAASAVFVLMSAGGCSSLGSTQSDIEASAEVYSAHVAFAGGGWRAHTGHSGWITALLNGSSSNQLNEVFKNVGTISSNSGGSWFSTMLMYSDRFVSEIEAPNAISAWPDNGGWLGKQQNLFDQASFPHYGRCSGVISDLFIPCVFATYTGSTGRATYWKKVVEDLVFKDYPLNLALNGKRQPWAEDKSLLLSASMLTNEAVLGTTGAPLGEIQYYQACLSPSKPKLKSSWGGYWGEQCVNEQTGTPDVIPVTFSSLPNGTSLKPPAFLSAVGEGLKEPTLALGYSENTALPYPPFAQASINNPQKSDDVPVVTAAAASSAAVGFLASGALLHVPTWDAAYAASGEALSFQLDGTLQHIKASGMSVHELANKKVVKIADGGPVDNTGVAQLVNFLQTNPQAGGFNIVAFDNIQKFATLSTSEAKVGTDIANLFGENLPAGNKLCAEIKDIKACLRIPNLQIFETQPLTNTALSWSAAANDNKLPNSPHELIYTKYHVTTIDNPTFGITAGTKGILHVFTCAWSDAGTVPQNSTKDLGFKAYGDMFRFINTGLHADSKKGLKHLQKALGLTN